MIPRKGLFYPHTFENHAYSARYDAGTLRKGVGIYCPYSLKSLILTGLVALFWLYPLETIPVSRADSSARGGSASGGKFDSRHAESTVQFVAVEQPFIRSQKTLKVWITAYSSTPEETDATPFTTASGTAVRHGIVATNILPFGTQIQIPELFGEKIFVVEDRMHARKKNVVDIWMPSRQAAKTFGAAYTEIVVLN